MWLYRQLYTIIRGVAAISVPIVLVSCSSPSQSEVDTQSNLTPQTLTQIPDSSSEEISRAAINTDLTLGSPSALRAANVRAGYVSLEWSAAPGDTIHSLPGEDTVSYYRILRNGQPLVDAFSTRIEDTNPPNGDVIYAVQAVKFDLSPEFVINYSTFVEQHVFVPSSQVEQLDLNAQFVDSSAVDASLTRLKSCVMANPKPDGTTLCTNHLGHAWPVFESGESGELLPHTSSVAGQLYVTVENTEAQFGPIPGVPQWIVNDLSTGESMRRDLALDAYVNAGERVLVNGVVVSDNNEVVISGTVYQSYLPRSLGPGPGVLPITSAYFIARMDALTGKVIKFERVSLSKATGAVATVSNGVLEMFHIGLVTWVDAKTLSTVDSLRVSGVPVFSDESTVYAQSVDADQTISAYQIRR